MTIGVSPAAGFFAHDDDRPVGYVHVVPADNDVPDRWSVGLVLDPREDGHDVAVVTLLHAASKHVAEHGGGTLVLWRHRSDAAEDAAIQKAGFHAARELFQMRVPLPIA
jgi:hypothetical protein